MPGFYLVVGVLDSIYRYATNGPQSSPRGSSRVRKGDVPPPAWSAGFLHLKECVFMVDKFHMILETECHWSLYYSPWGRSWSVWGRRFYPAFCIIAAYRTLINKNIGGQLACSDFMLYIGTKKVILGHNKEVREGRRLPSTG